SADGTRFSASLAESPEPSGKAVVILPDVRGLYPFYVELAERFASAGHHAIAIDCCGSAPARGRAAPSASASAAPSRSSPPPTPSSASTASWLLRQPQPGALGRH